MEAHETGFGGGCHWCTEAVFQSLRGIVRVRQGFIAADPPYDGFSEAVAVAWDPVRISLEDLVAVHLATHASTSMHKMRGKYRSAIYVHEPATAIAVRAAIERLGHETGSAFVTEVLPFRAFRESDPRFRDYYLRNRAGPFCESYIEPKLALLRQRFARLQVAAATGNKADA
ncbi:peptide-methionine (S)-S-oxide reductase [Novosphingobium sp.]|jgi:peptide-methionine (S)-S-oxide reductase|uniref:peptide-methionine (S)-S-oxide reductase n=1 Tax=Novosphingobium sp. TaxID=1874826 RepID=UPI000CCB904D|nr:MAG: peptide methionine sulfoxide reductase [Alphaproteobacteria bacterium HGW-Alphaproteobacteria-8]